MNLKEILSKLKNTDNENLIDDINLVVNNIKSSAVKSEQERFSEKLTEQKTAMEQKINKLKIENRASVINTIANNLAGNDPKKVSLLKKITDLEASATEEEIKEAFKKSIKENQSLINFNNQAAKQPNYDNLESFNENFSLKNEEKEEVYNKDPYPDELK